MPMTQEVIADALGLTSVHVNRTLQRLSSDGYIELSSGRLTILDVLGLQRIGGFDPNYLNGGDWLAILRLNERPVRVGSGRAAFRNDGRSAG